jgi:hypothetical protein
MNIKLNGDKTYRVCLVCRPNIKAGRIDEARSLTRVKNTSEREQVDELTRVNRIQIVPKRRTCRRGNESDSY